MNKIYYLYTHTRIDKNEVFYVGIGTQNKRSKYKRAQAKDRKNSIWNNIVKKTTYTIEIIIESNDYDFIKQKEIEFIKLYGKIKDGTGSLSNITDGGEGCLGYIPTLEVRQAHSKRMKGKKASEETKRKQSMSQRGKKVSEETGKKISQLKKGIKLNKKIDNKHQRVLHIEKNIVYPSLCSAAREYGFVDHTFGRLLKKGELKDFKIISEKEFKDKLLETGQIIPKLIRSKHTEEHKRKIGEKSKGRIFSEETRNKLSISNSGKTRSLETKEKLSLNSSSNVKVRHVITNEVFHNITTAANKYNLEVHTLAKQLKSGYSRCEFEYVNKESNRKELKILKNKKTEELFYSIAEAAKSVGLKNSCLSTQLSRNSKKCEFEYYIEKLENLLKIA